MKKTTADILLALTALAAISSGKGSQNRKSLPEVPLRVINSPFSTKETIGTVDRWMNKLQIPKQQKLVMQKSLRSWPTDAKGRITKDQIEQIFEGMIPYTVQILRDKLRTSNDEINEDHMVEQFETVIKSFLSDFEESPWNISPSEQTALLHMLFGNIQDILGLLEYSTVADPDNFFTEALYDFGLDPMRNWFQNEANKQGWPEEIDELFAEKLADFVYHLKEARVLAIRGAQKKTKYSMYSILNKIGRKSGAQFYTKKITDAENIEVIVYPKLEEMLQDSVIADSYGTVLSGHYRKALFWFRGFILDDILYVQELQNDHASTYKKPLAQRLTDVIDSPVDKTKFKHDITREDAFWWSLIYGTEKDSKGRATIEKDFWMNSSTPSRFQVPPTDWVRSDILLAFAVAASLGLNKVAFCEAKASLIMVGGKKEGQEYFYDKFVPAKIKSVAKKYGIIPEEIITLPLIPPNPYGVGRHSSKFSIKCQSWRMPDKVMQFFREQGYPIFG